MGHFRATVLGNFVKNINLAAGNKVTAVNYLGDWGTQFGLLSLGYQNYGDYRLLEEDPMRHLHSVYVQACQTLGSTNEGKAMASALATELERGQRPDLVNLWHRFRALSLGELQRLYARMNVHFDHYEYESDFVIAAKQLVDHLIKRRIARKEADGSVTAGSHEPGKRVILLKSSGGTLYLTRDLAAAISRSNCYNFDRMHYVVEDGQREHFMNLSHILTHLGYDWAKANASPWPLHIRFARVSGASSRRGNGLFLGDILDAAKQEARRRMLQSPNTRITPSDDVMFESVADHLGVTWLVAEMLRRPRLQPVYLNLHCHGNQPCGHSSAYSVAETPDLTGLGLQYCHARLFSLEQKAISRGLLGNGDADNINSQLLHAFHKVSSDRASRAAEEEVCGHLALLPDVLTCAYIKYEADGLLRYCTRLTSLIGRAWQFLPVLTAESQELGLMLFVCVLQELPEPRTRRGASFYEVHEIHIPREEVNAPSDKVYVVEVTFETAAIDPFPPGCSHVFGQSGEELEACYKKLDRRVHLPELYNNNSGIFIHEITTGGLPQQLPYLQETLLSEAGLFCAKHQCEVKVERSALYRNGNPIGRLPAGTSIYPFRGMTFMWSVHWRNFFKSTEYASHPRIRSFQVAINSAETSFVRMFINCGDANCTLSMDVRLYTALSHSVYILPNQMFSNQSLSSFALILDGPEFSLNTGTFDRRLQLFRDGHLMVLGTYVLPQMQQPLETFVQATEFLTFADVFAKTRSRNFDIIVRFYDWPIYDLSSGSVSRRHLAWSMVSQPCRKTAMLPSFHPPSSQDSSKNPSIAVNFSSDTSPTCQVKIDEQRTGLDLIQLYVYPVFQGCRESEVKFDGANVLPFAAAPSHSRFCSPGYFLSKVPPHKCEPCPEDTFSDPDTASEECLPCPDVRNSTQHLPARSSMHCTNHMLDRERERLAHKAVNLVPSVVRRLAKTEVNFEDSRENVTLNEKELLRHLAPDLLLLKQQGTAEALFKKITHLTFSTEEIFVMILIALALAMMGAVFTFIIGIGSRRTTYASQRKTVINRLLKWIYRRLRDLNHRMWESVQRYCKPRCDRRPIWQKRKSAAFRSGNVYQIESAKEEEAEAKFYEELQISLVNLITCEERPARQSNECQKGATRMSECDEVTPVISAKKKNEPDIPDHAILEIVSSNLKCEK
ncbi:unnamed protein product [Taenia asiatica]|uniref:Probable arginine--tRNA ligase, mitochondrial n=1 Tax=Taenia asiatica TaxID=60517 RepID=A0A158R6S7_TAEAS|nr:unnamed protein product [Taenia asiatica]